MIKSILSSLLQLYIKCLKNAMLPAGIRSFSSLLENLFLLPWKVLYCFALVSAEMLQSKFALETLVLCIFFQLCFLQKHANVQYFLKRIKQEIFSHKKEIPAIKKHQVMET